MQQINLFVKPPKPRLDYLSARGLLLLSTGLALLLAGLYAEETMTLRAREAQAAALNNQLQQQSVALAKLSSLLPKQEKDPALEVEAKRLATELELKPRILEAVKGKGIGDPHGFSAYLEGLAQQRPEGVWLTEFRLLEGGNKLLLSGGALKPDQVPLYLHRLAEAPTFAGKLFDLFYVGKPVKEKGKAGEEAEEPTGVRFSVGNRIDDGKQGK